MASPLERTLQELTDMQRKAVEWEDGPLLVLAGPGSGKTRVLTCRIARLLEASPDERFRILGLTFTNKAAHEMRTRVAALVPGAEERAYIDTFHGFCAQFLRQHGVHCGVKPNFGIYSRTADRKAVLEDALRREAKRSESDDDRLLHTIDALKTRLVDPEQAASYLRNNPRLAPSLVDRMGVDRIGLAYRLYEEELVRANALDFNSLIRFAFELLSYPALARHCRTMYRYWLVDEFQDTNGPQYRLLRRMAGDNFRQVFAVADDDQTIYEWNGANVRRIRSLVDDFGCEVIQLTDNFRCPASVVEAANRLVVYNARRDLSKVPADPVALRSEGEGEIECNVFSEDRDEASRIATEVSGLDASERGETAVLARSRALLEPVREALGRLNVPTALLGRRDDFASPQIRWLVACLKQIARPLDRRNMGTLTATFEDFAGVPLETEEVIARSETDQGTLLSAWLDALSANIVETPATLGMRGRQRGTMMKADRNVNSGVYPLATPALGGAPPKAETPPARRAPDPEVLAKPTRRRFSAEYRLRIVEEADRCREPGEIGRLLRREGLYSSHLSTWRKARRQGALQGLTPRKRGPKPAPSHPLGAQVRRLEAQVARLEKELATAHTILEVQGKVAGLLGFSLRDGKDC